MANGFKTGGRQKGTLNKKTIHNREVLQEAFDTEVSSGNLLRAIQMLPVEKYVSAMLKIVSYLVPKASGDNCAEEPKEDTCPLTLSVITPVATREEADNLRGEHIDDDMMAALVFYNHNSRPRWFDTGRIGCTPEEWEERYGKAAAIAYKWAWEKLTKEPMPDPPPVA